MNSTLFTGSGAALATPFTNGKVDFEALGRLIDMQLSGGTDALIVCGTTGEPPTLTSAEKNAVLEFALSRAAGRIPVIAGTGANSTAASVEQSVQAQKIGADGLLVVTPYYNRTTQRGLISHFTAIADAVSIPVILYNVPSRTGVNLLPETAAALSVHPNIRGIKEAGGDVGQMAELARLCGSSLVLYAGNDDQVLPMLALGGQGVISVAANVVPKRMHDMVCAWFSGDIGRCREIQLSLLPLIRQLFAETNPIPVKAALEIMGICKSDVRLPLVKLSEERWNPLRKAMEDLGISVE